METKETEIIDPSLEKAIYGNPYKHFYNEQRVDRIDRVLDPDDPDAAEDIDIDDYIDHDFDAEFVEEYLKGEISRAKKNKAKYVYQAMEYDPAFMTDPYNDYYMEMIPQKYKESLSDKQLKTLISLFDPVTWAEMNLLQKHGGWKPRSSRRGIPYQAMLVRSKSKNIVARAGRRIGKTAALVAKVLHKAFTWTSDGKQPVFNIVVFTPNQSQINTIFKMMEVFIDDNPDLLSMIKEGGKIPTRKNPQTTLELKNGVTITGYVSGSSSIRGSAADFLIIDEASFLEPDDFDSVIALLNEHPDVELWLSSTPKGLKDWFYERCHDEEFVEFYFPTDKFHPNWSHQMERTFKKQLTDSGYKHEVLADFSADGEGVFQHQFVEAALTDYKYKDQKYNSNWIYGLGIDWNDTENGTQIVVVGYNKSYKEEGTKPYRVVDTASISVEGKTQTKSVQKVREMNRKWHCKFFYADYGFGSTQIELLHEFGAQAMPNTPDWWLRHARSVNFSEKFIIRDPWLKKKVKKPAKPYMISNAVHVFEEYNIDIPEEDEVLEKQLLGYTIDSISPNGTPKYERDPKWGDHKLDALVLALLGFHMEYSTLVKPIITETVGHVNHSEYSEIKSPGMRATSSAQAKHDADLARDKAHELKELKQSGGTRKAYGSDVAQTEQKDPSIKRRNTNEIKRTIFKPVKKSGRGSRF